MSEGTIPEFIAAKANRCLPPGFKASAIRPMPWRDEDGIWHEVADDVVALRVRRDPISEIMTYVDTLLREEDRGMTDVAFHERIIAPILAAFEAHEESAKSAG